MTTAPPARRKRSTRAPRERYTVCEQYDVVEFATDVLKLKLWTWEEVALRSLYGLPFTCQAQHDMFATLTADVYGEPQDYTPGTELSELVCVVGRRSGKTKGVIGPIVCYEALRDWTPYLDGVTADTEHVYGVLVSVGLSQARKLIQSHVGAMFLSHPDLAAKIEVYEPSVRVKGIWQNTTGEQIVLRNGFVILSRPANSTAGRGFPTPVLILDEVAHYHKVDGSARQDTAVYDSLEPGTADFAPQDKTILCSSPADKRGLLYDWYKTAARERAYRIVLKGGTETCRPMTPALRRKLDRRKRRNPVTYSIEYGAEFADSISGLLIREAVDACVREYTALPWTEGYTYIAACDPSEATTGGDAWSMGIGHWEPKEHRVVIDCIETLAGGRVGRRSLDTVVLRMKEILDAYKLQAVWADQYIFKVIQDLCTAAGIGYWRHTWTQQMWKTCGAALEAVVAQGRLVLPNHPRELVDHLTSLSRVYTSNGDWTIRKPRSEAGHGDHADVVMMLVSKLDRGIRSDDDYIGGRFYLGGD